MTFNLIDTVAAILSAIISSMGLGGGGVLILYLTLFKETPQLYAQGLNLLFFVPCAITSLIIYAKSKMLKPKVLLPLIGGGLIGVFAGRYLLDIISPFYLRAAFAVFLIVVGAFTVFRKEKKEDKEIGC